MSEIEEIKDTTTNTPFAESSDVPRYVVNLDLEPEDRWTDLLEIYKDQYQIMFDDLSDTLGMIFGPKMGSIIESLAAGIMSSAAKLGLFAYGDELKAIAEKADISLGRLAILQLSYEMFAACTSIVTTDEEGHPIHARSMDWEMPALRNLTVELDFQRGGETVFLATSWAGYLGVLTAVKPGGFSVSVNFRRVGDSPMENLKKAIGSAWPVGFLVRCVFEEDNTFEEAVNSLAKSELIAPVYFTIAGMKKDEGVLLTRNRTEDENRWVMGDDGDVVATNMDHWSKNRDENILWSIQRRTIARDSLDECSNTVTPHSLWKIMYKQPYILNEENIYSCVMSPQNGTLVTKIPPLEEDGFVEAEEEYLSLK